ncbi:unnamed protein product [Blepharisma stoltei]|uniref:PKD/REJ-like domain-containing protein n=1 Tax=Blepharisma stoltei TaxID=1481888 RepID=A0AAU9JF14_9CILI|nr:unnamed protein product [Blepharisma stoltei]
METIYDHKCEYCDALYFDICSTGKWFDCSECRAGVLVGSACLDEYPYGYINAKEDTYAVIDAEFSEEFAEYDIFKTGKNRSQHYFFMDPELNFDPIPAIKRGLYFENNRFLKTEKTIYLSHSFSIAAWVHAKIVGIIIRKEGKFTFSSSHILNITLKDPLDANISMITPEAFYSSWMHISFSVSYSSGATTIYSYLNNIQHNSISQDKSIFRDITSELVIGDPRFAGFIYNFKLYIGAVHDFISYSEISICQPDKDDNSLWSCELFEYWDGSACKQCNSSCETTCAKFPSCKLCNDQLCQECSGFSDTSNCYKCIERAHNLNEQNCACDANTILTTDGSDYFCEYCDLDYCSNCRGQGYFSCLECVKGELVDNVCLGQYPTGLEECAGKELCVMAEINSKDNFNETYGKFIAGANKASYNPFNSPENEDPVLAKDRGFFFDGNFAFLQSEQSYYFSHTFSLLMWIWNQGNGDILKQGDRLLLASNGALPITLQDRFSQNFTFQTSEISFEGWTYLSYTISYESSVTSLWAYENNREIITRGFPDLLFRDIVNSTLFIGKSLKSHFKGFLYKLQIWNSGNKFEDSESLGICGPSLGDCLSPCKINEFYSVEHDKCKGCPSSCNKGCIIDDTCNICQDPLCAICPNFGKTNCVECIPHASGIEKFNCVENYCLSLDRLKCIRTPYESSPELYWFHSIPQENVIVGNWSGEFIINTIHGFIESVELLNNTDFFLNSNECSFSPFNENFTCSFTLSINPSYSISSNPSAVQVQYQGYLYPISFNAFYDDFSKYLMSHQELINIKYYFEISDLKIKLYNQLVFTEEFCTNEKCSSAQCDKILSKDSIISLGKSVSCFKISKNELEIYLGHIQESAESLTFIEKIFADSNTNETNLAYITMSIKEEKPPKPKASITQISSICCSCELTLDGSRSTGMGNLTFLWSLSKFLSYSGGINQKFYNITLESCESAKDHNYFEVTLNVTDKFGQSDLSTTSVNMIYDEVAVSIANKETLNIGTDSPLKLKFQYQKSTLIDLDPNPSISWSVSKSNRQLSEDTDYSTSGVEFAYLFSKLGEYVVTANVLFNRGTYTRSASVKVVAAPPPPNLMVLGVDTTVYSNSYITVNLTATYGSDEIYPLEKGSVKFTEKSCIYGKFVEIAGNSFNLEIRNKNSYFTCDFTISLTDYPSVTENHWVLVSPGIAPKVYIITKYPFLDWSSPVRILAHVENETSTIISWGEANNLTFTPTTPTDQAGITIKEFSLTPGREYEFTATVIDKETYAKSKVSLKRYVNCPPNRGTFEIDNNSEGITLKTRFGILFSGWSDPEGNEPLSYQIFIKLEKSSRALIPKTTENKFTIKLGIIGEATLLGRVYDSYGTFIEVEAIVYLNDTDSISIKNFTENLVANGTETMDSSLLISSITAAGLYISNTTNDDEEINSSISNSVDALDKWMNNSMKGTSLSDSSTVIDSVNILLGSATSLNETTLVKLHGTQDSALNKTKVLDTHAYMAALPNIDLLMQNLGSLLEKNSSDLSEIKIHSFINKTYSEASLKYLIPVNPNEEPVNFTGIKFNSTCLSVNAHSASDRVSYNSSKPNTDAQFNIDTSKNPDSTIYLLSVLTLNPFKSISDSFQKEATSFYSYPEPFKFSEGNLNINSPDTLVDSNFDYSDQYESSLVQVGISQNTNSIFSPVITAPPLTNLSVVVAYDAYDKDLQMTCSVYLQQISQFSFKFCETFFKSGGVATCTCEIAGLIMIPPYPSVSRNLKDRANSVNLEIPRVGAIPVFVIFGSLLFVLYFSWLDISRLERKYADPLKEQTLSINETIAKEISMLSSNLYVNNQLINVDKLMQIWETGEIYEVENEWNDNEERKESETTNLERDEVYPYFKKQLRNKLKSIIEDQNILNSLLTFERIKMHIENCIGKRNLEDIETVINALCSAENEESENFLIWARFLYKEKNGLLTFISKIKQKQIRNLLRFSYMPVINLVNCMEIFKEKIKYKHYNWIIQAIRKYILNPYEDENSPKNDFDDAKLKCESKETLIKSIKKLEGNIFAYIKLRTPTLKLERFIRKWIFASLKESLSQPEGKAAFVRYDISRRDTNIPVGVPIDLDDIKVEGIGNELEGMIENPNDDDYTPIFFSILPKVFTKLVEHKIDNFTPSTTFIQFFISNNDIFGIIGNTDLNFSRKGRLIYFFAAVSTEIAIAISAFDGYTKYISNQVDLIFQFPEVTLVIWFVSFILGFLPLFLKVFLKDRFLENQLVKNKNDSTKNWKVMVGYLLSFAWIGGCWLYSFEKLNNYPIANIGAYLLYILQALISFLMINGLILPVILAVIEMYCCFKFVNWRVKRWIIFFKRRFSKNKVQILPTNDYEFSNRK